MRLLHGLDRALFRLVSIVAQLLLATAVIAGFYQVLARFILESPSAWSEAWTRASVIWAVMLGVALAFRQGAMLSVEMLHSMLGGSWARRLEHGVLLIVVFFLSFLAWVGVQMTWRVRFQTMPSLEASISWVYIAIPIGAVLSLVAVIAYWAEGPRRTHIDNI